MVNRAKKYTLRIYSDSADFLFRFILQHELRTDTKRKEFFKICSVVLGDQKFNFFSLFKTYVTVFLEAIDASNELLSNVRILYSSWDLALGF